MNLDAYQFFDLPSAPRDLAQVAGTYASTNVLDYGVLSGIPASASGGGARDMGVGDNPALKLLVQVSTTFVGGTSLQIAIQGAIDDLTGNPSTFNTCYTSPAIVTANLNAGSRLFDIDFPRPPDGIAIPRFVRLAYIILGTMTAGKVVAGVVLDRVDQPYSSTDNAILGGYPAGINIAN